MRRFTTASLALTLAATSVLAGAAAVMAQDGSDLKIGLVTDVGTINDRNFNQFSWEGTQAGAEAIGAAAPQFAISQASADIAPNIQAFVDQQYDIIVTVGFAAGEDTANAAEANPDINFIGVDQGVPEGLENYIGIQWREQEPGYLAGIVAASLSETGHVGAVGGTAVIPAVVNYIEGYAQGALSVNPDVEVVIAYVSTQPGRGGVRRSGRWPGLHAAAAGAGFRHRRHVPGRRPHRQRCARRQPVTPASTPSASTSTSTSPPRKRPRAPS